MSSLIPARSSMSSPASFLLPSDSPRRHGRHPILIRQRHEIFIVPADDVDDDAVVSSELCQSFSVFSTIVTRLSYCILLLLHPAAEEEDPQPCSDLCQNFFYLKYLHHSFGCLLFILPADRLVPPLNVRCFKCRYLISKPCVLDGVGSACESCQANQVGCSLEDSHHGSSVAPNSCKLHTASRHAFLDLYCYYHDSSWDRAFVFI